MKRRRYRMTGVIAAVVLGCCLSACGKENEANILSAVEEPEAEESVQLSREEGIEAEKKEEIVYVKADASGNPQETTVETTLRISGEGQTVLDVSNLKEIKNTEGDEEFLQEEDGTLLWENQGNRITYEGTSEAKIPVEVRISYYLDGEEIMPEDLAGKSGEVTIRFDYENTASETIDVDGKEMEVSVPFLMLSMILLPEEHFSNVEINHGRLISVGDEMMAVGYALPGAEETLKLGDYEPTEEIEIPSYVEITADVTDFELEFTETIASTGLFGEIDTEKLKDADDLIDSMEDFKDASKKLTEGVASLLDGARKYQSYLNQYMDGVSELAEGADTLSLGLSALDEKTADLENGAKAVESGIAYLEQEIALLEAKDAGGEYAVEIAMLKETVEQLKSGSAAVSEGISGYGEGVSQASLGAAALSQGTKTLSDSGDSLLQGYASLISGIQKLNSGVSEFDKEGVQEIADLAGENLADIIDGIKALQIADQGYTNFAGIRDGVEGSVTFMIETEEIKAEEK